MSKISEPSVSITRTFNQVVIRKVDDACSLGPERIVSPPENQVILDFCIGGGHHGVSMGCMSKNIPMNRKTSHRFLQVKGIRNFRSIGIISSGANNKINLMRR